MIALTFLISQTNPKTGCFRGRLMNDFWCGELYYRSLARFSLPFLLGMYVTSHPCCIVRICMSFWPWLNLESLCHCPMLVVVPTLFNEINLFPHSYRSLPVSHSSIIVVYPSTHPSERLTCQSIRICFFYLYLGSHLQSVFSFISNFFKFIVLFFNIYF